jgi:glycosyltransferase involved in cell wall biosynthesis
MTSRDQVDAVVIGRNEGARLAACLASIAGQVRRIVYVDSGSTDGSVAMAVAAGAQVVTLDLSRPFTAARARNAGIAALAQDPPEFVQLVDGDCRVAATWVATALAAMTAHPGAVVVCGRRREVNPQASVYNHLADIEWNTPVGEALACGGDALMRYEALQAAHGFRDTLIAGEEPELCLRLRRAGGQIWRIDAEMTYHDANILRFGQWWVRTKRAGHAFAEGSALYGKAPERHWRRETQRAVFWGAALPVAILGAGAVVPALWLLALIYPVQTLRLMRKGGTEWGLFSMIGKFAEAQGVLAYWLGRLQGRQRSLIEYK